MDHSRYLDCLATDFHRLRAASTTNLGAPVPTCPGWSMADLVQHVGYVFAHKTTAMREGAEPEQWPPPGLAGEAPLPLLDRTYSELWAELVSRRPEERTGTWYRPDQSVGFWGRRMALETVVHRIDADLAAGLPVAPVPDDLALDGVDELLRVFLAFSVAEWGGYFTDVLGGSPGHTYELRSDERAWRVTTGPGRAEVQDSAAGAADADVTVTGSPEALLRWVWGRGATADGGGATVDGATVDGAPEAVEELRRCITVATQ